MKTSRKQTARDPNELAYSIAVDGSEGFIEVHDSAGRNVVGGLASCGLKVQGLASFSIHRCAGWSHQAPHRADGCSPERDRESDGNNHNRYRLKIFGKGSMKVVFETQANGAPIFLIYDVTLPITFLPGAKYWIGWESDRRQPGDDRPMSVWAARTTEPTARSETGWQPAAPARFTAAVVI